MNISTDASLLQSPFQDEVIDVDLIQGKTFKISYADCYVTKTTIACQSRVNLRVVRKLLSCVLRRLFIYLEQSAPNFHIKIMSNTQGRCYNFYHKVLISHHS